MILLNQRNNKPNMSGNSINFGLLNINEKCSNLKQVVPANSSDLLQYMYHAW